MTIIVFKNNTIPKFITDFVEFEIKHNANEIELQCSSSNEIYELNILSKLVIKLLLENTNSNINNLSNKIIKLGLNEVFNKNINNLPYSITKLYVGCKFNKSLNKIPSIKKLYYSSNYEPIIPNTIKTLYVNNNNLNLDLLSEGIETLIISNIMNKEINDLPSSIKKIVIHKQKINLINKLYTHKIITKSNKYFDNIFNYNRWIVNSNRIVQFGNLAIQARILFFN